MTSGTGSVFSTDSGFLSTPISFGLAAVSQDDGFKAHAPIVDKFLQDDISRARDRLPFDGFLCGLGADSNALGIRDEDVYRIATSQDVQVFRDVYCKHVTKETERYGRYCDLAKHVISQLPADSQTILFSRNDPNLIYGAYDSTRKPDVITLSSKEPSVANKEWEKYSAKGPKGVDWTWCIVLFLFEFKLYMNGILHFKDILPPPTVASSTAPVVPSNSTDTPSTASAQPLKVTCESSKPSEQKTTQRATAKSGKGKKSPSPDTILSASLATSTKSAKRKAMQMEADAVSETSSKRIRREIREPRQDLMIQCALHAVDQLSTVVNRRHCISGLVLDGRLWLAYYDHGGIVTSTPLDFVSDLYRFVLLIKTLAEMSPRDCGFIEGLEDVSTLDIDDTFSTLSSLSSQMGKLGDVETGNVDENSPDPAELSSQPELNQEGSSQSESSLEESSQATAASDADGTYEPSSPGLEVRKEDTEDRPKWRLKVKGHELLLFGSLVRRAPYGLVGRSGRVYAMKSRTLDIKNPNRKYAIKMSWPLARRISEAEILDKAKRELEALDGNPDHRKQHGDRNLIDCLPKLFLHEDLDELMKEGSFRFRTMHDEFLPENRVCRVLAFEYLIPLFALENLDDFKQCVRDMVQGHHFLFISPSRILHRDISIGNLMVRIEDGGRKIHGVLNDWDLAEVGEPTPDGHTGTRTGTRPFMAWELLVPYPPAHMERFDWESFFYVLYWIGCRYHEGKEIHTSLLSEWNIPDDDALRGIKQSVTERADSSMLQKFTDSYKPLVRTWIVPLLTLFRSGHQAKDAFILGEPKSGEEFDMETLGGHVTYEKVWEILQK